MVLILRQMVVILASCRRYAAEKLAEAGKRIAAAARERGRARDLEATAKELLAELEAELSDTDGSAEGSS
jgi:hypothetical protein